MKDLFIDLETYSSVSLQKSGVYPYAEAEDFEILLFGYSVDGAPVQVVDLASREEISEAVLCALTDPAVTKWAFNAAFERVCLSAWLRKHHPKHFRCSDTQDESICNYLDPAGWHCHMIWAAYLSLPLSLQNAGAVLQLDEQKLTEGKELIRYFCVPCSPNRANGFRTRNLPQHASDKWELFKRYNRRDVETELAIHERLQHYPVPESVWQEYALDQQINDRGILIDRTIVANAIAMDDRSRQELSDEMQRLTALDNPNSVTQLKSWLAENGFAMESLGKKTVAALLDDAPKELQKVLLLRQQLARSSVKKYQAMEACLCADGRARGCFQFYGASRSGRWAGRHIQLQNLPQNKMPDLEQARALVRAGDYAAIQMLYGDVPDTLSQLVRTAFIPRPGYKFIVSDYSAIEARVLSFLAGEQWRMDVFASNGDIYCASASAMFGVPVEKHGQNSHLRQRGKVAELALGYGGSVGALKAMGALEMGIPESELQPLVNSWRDANPNIVQFWWDVDEAVKNAVRMRSEERTHGLRFLWKGGMLFIELPSGRRLAYIKPRLEVNQFGGESVTYMGMGSTKKWERIESYGPKFTENIIQAISRDILAHAMQTLKDCYIVAHVHDELIIECPMETSLQEICGKMGRTPPWLPGLSLRADGYETMFYKKD